MKNIKKVTYIFTLFAISSNLCFPDSPLDEQDGLVLCDNDQRSIVRSFKDADNDEKAAWALTGVSALGAIFAAIGYKFYDSTKKTKSLGKFIVIKSPGKDGKPVEEIIPVYEKASDLPKNNKDKVKVDDVVFVKGEVEPGSKDADGFKNGKFLKCVNIVSGKNDAAPKLLIWGEVADPSTFFGHSKTPVVLTGDLVEELVFDWSADGLELSAPVADPVIVPPAPAAPAAGSDAAPAAGSDADAGSKEEENPAPVADSVPTGSPKDGSPIKKRSIKCKILGFLVATLSAATTLGALSAPYLMPPLASPAESSYSPQIYYGLPCLEQEDPNPIILFPCNSRYWKAHPNELPARCLPNISV